MELRRYWHILKRRWLLIVIPVAVMALFTLATYQSPPAYYNVGMHYLVSQQPSSQAADADARGLACLRQIVDAL